MKHLEDHNLLHPLQSGFRHHHSCQTALVRLCDTWLSAVNQSKVTGAVFLDLKKAFDLVDHKILLKKILLYINDHSTLSFFKSYLGDRTQYVFSNGNFSSLQVIRSGVPQGSVLGPLLFGIFINDLPLSLSDPNVSCDLFADDTSLHSHASNIASIQTSLQLSLNDVSDWCRRNRMAIHPQKTKCMVITSRQKHQTNKFALSLSIDSNKIDQVHEHRVLGVVLDEELKWQSHIDSVNKKVARSLFLLSKLKPFLDSDARKMFFHAHCVCHVNYASVVWSCAAVTHQKRLNSLLRRAAKVILPDPYLSTYEKQVKLNILPLKKTIRFQ
jgi:hypothetical protein